MKRLFTEKDIIYLINQGSSTIIAGKNDIFTPSAMDRIKEYKLSIKFVEDTELHKEIIDSSINVGKSKKIAIGSDHTGFHMKSILSKYLTDKGYKIYDVGTFSEESCDYPDLADEVAKKVSEKEVEFGIMIDATGIPSSITANKIAGIRAATCYNEFTAESARKHNNSNVLVLGAKALGEETLKRIIDKWLETSFEGGRHQRRLDKITSIEKRTILNKFYK
jgi:ribose 5-phosphate isomerase B